jgi:hypothetical protein
MERSRYFVIAIVLGLCLFLKMPALSQEAIVLGSDQNGDGYCYLLNLDSGSTLAAEQFSVSKPQIRDGIMVEDKTGQVIIYSDVGTYLFEIIPMAGKLSVERLVPPALEMDFLMCEDV